MLNYKENAMQVNLCIIEGTTSVMSTASTEKARLTRVILHCNDSDEDNTCTTSRVILGIICTS